MGLDRLNFGHHRLLPLELPDLATDPLEIESSGGHGDSRRQPGHRPQPETAITIIPRKAGLGRHREVDLGLRPREPHA